MIDDALTRAEVGYLGAASLLLALLAARVPALRGVTRDDRLEDGRRGGRVIPSGQNF